MIAIFGYWSSKGPKIFGEGSGATLSRTSTNIVPQGILHA